MSGESTQNWFNQGGAAYARYRPEYPPELAAFLASVAPTRALAVDVGCGTGQLTVQLAEHFEQTIGLDPSADQLANATPHARVVYRCCPAEQLDVKAGQASLITAAQAAHWFDLPRFYAEVRRVAAPDAVVSLLSYGVLVLDGDLNELFQRFYSQDVGRFWPPERRLVDTGYASIDFPFDERQAPPMTIRKDWNLEELLGYISTWSAVRSALEKGQEALLHRFAAELTERWGDPARTREMRWPINMRLGTVQAAQGTSA
ncbi:Methyltransferase domain-containing protein [Roseateles sp. YR242]|uniref:class I SAM-dependent methyltransferase n=1 Tax=Roseateles sp. YR242 TaxID=1855305 RepID=UPI0008D2E3CA|nr:class I SAM-dependent methyltransferase [Roseateles sp. YR242]SEK53839.1 Methyltransferase domain-containing protein [Roseateles sp. YR242]